MTRPIIIVLFATILTLASCTDTSGDTRVNNNLQAQESILGPQFSITSMAYCEELGYTVEARENTDCETFFVCIFPDGTECHSGFFQQGLCGVEFSYCRQQGYDLEVLDREVRCNFPDGSYCAELDYLLGECQMGGQFP